MQEDIPQIQHEMALKTHLSNRRFDEAIECMRGLIVNIENDSLSREAIEVIVRLAISAPLEKRLSIYNILKNDPSFKNSEPSFDQIRRQINHLKTIFEKGDLSNNAPITDNFIGEEYTIHRLVDWIRLNGGIVDGVDVEFLPSGERGVYATKDIKEGEKICVIPESLIITYERASKSNLNKKWLDKGIHLR